MPAQRKFSNHSFAEANYTGEDFSYTEFYRCDFSDSIFHECDFTNSTFKKCVSNKKKEKDADTDANMTDEPFVDFSEAVFEKARLSGCDFPNAKMEKINLSNATIERCDFSGADLKGGVFDNACINDLDVRQARLHLASFRNVRIEQITFLPARKIHLWQIFRLLYKKNPSFQGTIYTSGTELSPFTTFCNKQFRLTQLLSEVSHQPKTQKIPYTLAILLFGLISDFGASLTRWFVTCCVIIAVYAALFYFGIGLINVPNAPVLLSVLHFVNSSPGDAELNWLVASEKILGFFMLGILVSILNTKFFQRW